MILDGWGNDQNPEVSAVAQAHTPFMDGLPSYPNATLHGRMWAFEGNGE